MEYILKKTAAVTAKANGLVSVKHDKHTYLFDFSNLDQLSDFEEREIELLKEYALKNIRGYNCVIFPGKEWDSFDACDMEANFSKLRIYSKQGNLLYEIFKLQYVKLYRKTRNSVYETSYEVKMIEKKFKMNVQNEDVEI